MTLPNPDMPTGRWLALFRRLRSLEGTHPVRGIAVVNLRLVFSNGQLRHWTKPTCKPVEPGGDLTLLDLLCQDDTPGEDS